MATFYSDIQTIVNGPAYGQPLQNRVKVNKLNGRVRYLEAMYQAPSSGAAPAIGDKIVFGELPVSARIIPHLSQVSWTTGTASCTLALGDSIVAARHMVATAITTAGAAIPAASQITQSGVGDITTGSNQVINLKSVGSFQMGFNIVGTGIPLGAYITGVDLVAKSVTISAPATATTASLAITTNGGSYVTTDDSNNIGNLFAGTTDDAAIVGTIAGAQVANNQVIVLKIAYVQD